MYIMQLYGGSKVIPRHNQMLVFGNKYWLIVRYFSTVYLIRSKIRKIAIRGLWKIIPKQLHNFLKVKEYLKKWNELETAGPDGIHNRLLKTTSCEFTKLSCFGQQ